MENSALFKLSFMITLIGLLFLLVLSNFSEPEKTNVIELKNNPNDYLNKEVRLSGFIENLKFFDSGEVSFNINDLKNSFEARGSFSNISIKNKDYCEVTGILKEYDSRYFIEITSIKTE